MIKGLYSAASGMVALQDRQDVIANNIANVSTAGFRRHMPVQLGFYETFTKASHLPEYFETNSTPSGGVKLVETYPDLAQGGSRQTDNPLDVALVGPGFIAVNTKNGERYTRTGNLSQNSDGLLCTQHGEHVLGVNGEPIDVRGGRVIIAGSGEVTVDGVPAGKIKVVEFADPKRLMRAEENLYRAEVETASQMAPAADTQLEQGMLEMANVNLPTEMIQMTTGIRAYEANQKVLTTVSDTMSTLIERVAMPQ